MTVLLILIKKVLAKNPKKLKTKLLFRSLHQINHLFRNSKMAIFCIKLEEAFYSEHESDDFVPGRPQLRTIKVVVVSVDLGLSIGL